MKKSTLFRSTILALTLPIVAIAQDKAAPAKSGDAVKNPPAAAPARSVEPLRAPNDAEPGKSSTAVKTPNPAGVQAQFSGSITEISRDERTIIITDTSKVTRRLHVGDTTKIKRGDKDASWDDLKVGAKVDGTCSGDASLRHAETINING